MNTKRERIAAVKRRRRRRISDQILTLTDHQIRTIWFGVFRLVSLSSLGCCYPCFARVWVCLPITIVTFASINGQICWFRLISNEKAHLHRVSNLIWVSFYCVFFLVIIVCVFHKFLHSSLLICLNLCSRTCCVCFSHIHTSTTTFLSLSCSFHIGTTHSRAQRTRPSSL